MSLFDINLRNYLDCEARKIWKTYYDKPCDDYKAYDFINSLIDKYSPDPAFTMDVAKMEDGSYKLIEINSFCCATLYGNDLNEIVKAVNKLAINDYKDIFG